MIRHVCNRKVYLHSTELFIHRYFISIFSMTVMYGVCTYSFYDRRPGLLGRRGVTPCWHTDWLHPLHLLNNSVYRFIIVPSDVRSRIATRRACLWKMTKAKATFISCNALKYAFILIIQTTHKSLLQLWTKN